MYIYIYIYIYNIYINTDSSCNVELVFVGRDRQEKVNRTNIRFVGELDLAAFEWVSQLLIETATVKIYISRLNKTFQHQWVG